MPKIPNWDRFDAVADSYDDDFTTTREPGRRLVDFAGIGQDMSVLEFGCGTGIATRLAAERVGPGGSVLATDIADAMLAVARRNITDAHVEFCIVDGAAPSDLPLAAYDAIYANCVLMGFEDVAAVLRRWAALARDGGMIAFTSFSDEMRSPFTLVPEAFSVLRRHLGGLPTGFPQTEIANVDACASALEDAGLTGIEVEQHDLGYRYRDFAAFWGEAWGSLFRLRLQSLTESALAAMKRDLEAAMTGAFDGDGLYRPNLTILAKARR